jgi:hypothetical protein
MAVERNAPLCPAGHLPHEGGDRLAVASHFVFKVSDLRNQSSHLISPRVGEMAGRPEGGAYAPALGMVHP